MSSDRTVQTTRTNEAFWWSLFSAGGVIAALVIPGLVLVTGVLLPFGGGRGMPEITYARLHGSVTWWPIRLILFVVVFLSFFHCAHRIRHVLTDLGWRGAPALLGLLCYGGAIAGTVAAAMVVIRL